VKTPCLDCPTLAFRTRRPPTSTVISGAVRVSSCALSTSSSSAGHGVLALEVVAEAVGDRFEHGEGVHIGLLLRGVRAARREGNRHVVAGLLRRLLDAAQPPSTIRSASETFLPPDCAPLNSLLDAFERLQHLRQLLGWLTSQSFCGARRMRAPFAPPRLSEPRKVDADAQAVETSCETDRPEARILP
jgi:hypothetical protein